MKTLIIYMAIALISLTAFAKDPSYFLDQNGNPKSELDYIGKMLSEFYGVVTDKPISIYYHNGSSSLFNVRETYVKIANRHRQNQMHYHKVLAHEASHLALYRLTNGASITRRFRFFDEGFANIMGNKLLGKNDFYKVRALNTANSYLDGKYLSLAYVQDWDQFFCASGEQMCKWNAYRVGSTFDYFIIDRWGERTLYSFFVNIGETRNLSKTISNLFQMTLSEFEAAWIQYIRNNDTAPPPQIVNSYPPLQEGTIPVGTKEIYIEFSEPMNPRFTSVLTPCQKGICYTNMYWKTEKILAIKIPETLPSSETFNLQIGHQKWSYQFESDAGKLFPITKWTFRTADH